MDGPRRHNLSVQIYSGMGILHNTALRLSTISDPAEIEQELQHFARAVLEAWKSQPADDILPQDLNLRRPADRRLAKNASAEILRMLRQGPCSNRQLSRVTSRYGARIHDLRRAGYNIRSRQIGSHLWVYQLV